MNEMLGVNIAFTYVPSKPRTESSASRGSSNSTKANPGGFLATQTFLKGPYLLNAASISCFEALLPRFPTYTLHDKSHSLYLDIITFLKTNLLRKIYDIQKL